MFDSYFVVKIINKVGWVDLKKKLEVGWVDSVDFGVCILCIEFE